VCPNGLVKKKAHRDDCDAKPKAVVFGCAEKCHGFRRDVVLGGPDSEPHSKKNFFLFQVKIHILKRENPKFSLRGLRTIHLLEILSKTIHTVHESLKRF